MATIKAWAAHAAGGRLQPFEYDPGPLGAEEVEVAVEHCGICHSDLSMLDNEWGMTAYPFVPGHEGVGRVVAMGAQAKGLHVGQRVGIGWNAHSCLHCAQCLAGRQHLCRQVQGTITGRHGAFAEKVRAHWVWAMPLPDALDPRESGPLLCGGITVFAPLLELGIKPDRPRRHRRHRRTRAHGAEILPRLGLRSHRVHLQRLQGRGGARIRRAPRGVQPRQRRRSRRWPGAST